MRLSPSRVQLSKGSELHEDDLPLWRNFPLDTLTHLEGLELVTNSPRSSRQAMASKRESDLWAQKSPPCHWLLYSSLSVLVRNTCHHQARRLPTAVGHSESRTASRQSAKAACSRGSKLCFFSERSGERQLQAKRTFMSTLIGYISFRNRCRKPSFLLHL